jgi:VanZ family protein
MRICRQAWRGWVWPLVFAAAILVESSQSVVPLPANVWQADKIAHFLAYGLLATVTLRALRIASLRWRAIAAVFLVSLFGATDEIHQHFTPGRSCDVFDWLADTLGAGLAVGLYVFWPTWRRILDIRPRAPKPAEP